MPGTYTVRLIAAGETLSKPLHLVMDPRVKTSPSDLEQQFAISHTLYDQMLQATQAIHEVTVLRDQINSGKSSVPASAAAALESKFEKIAGREQGEDEPRGGPAGSPTLASVRIQLERLEHSIQNADAAPTPAQLDACQQSAKPLQPLLDQWDAVKNTDLKAINNDLRHRDLPQLSIDTRIIDHTVEDQIEFGDED